MVPPLHKTSLPQKLHFCCPSESKKQNRNISASLHGANSQFLESQCRISIPVAGEPQCSCVVSAQIWFLFRSLASNTRVPSNFYLVISWLLVNGLEWVMFTDSRSCDHSEVTWCSLSSWAQEHNRWLDALCFSCNCTSCSCIRSQEAGGEGGVTSVWPSMPTVLCSGACRKSRGKPVTSNTI